MGKLEFFYAKADVSSVTYILRNVVNKQLKNRSVLSAEILEIDGFFYIFVLTR